MKRIQTKKVDSKVHKNQQNRENNPEKQQQEAEHKGQGIKSRGKNRKPSTLQYSYYLSTGFRILGTVLAGLAIGYWIDSAMENETPFFTIGLGFLAVFISLYQIIREFS